MKNKINKVAIFLDNYFLKILLILIFCSMVTTFLRYILLEDFNYQLPPVGTMPEVVE